MPSDDAVERAYLEGKRAWPTLDPPWQRFVEMALAADPPERELLRHAGDLYLACAAGQRDSQAILTIDREFIGPLRGRLRRFASPTTSVEDVFQVVRQRLFTGSHPRIATYAPTAPLRNWIRVVATRAAIDQQRAERARQTPVDALPDSQAAASADAASLAIRRQYKADLEAALRAQISLLSPRDRAVLRLHLVENVSVEKIAVMYGVHRVTVARWIWKAGDQLLAALRAHFRERFRILPPELDSLAALLQSQISLDLPQLLS